MAAAPDDEENDLNFSDIDSDNEEETVHPTPSHIPHKSMPSVIAHKELKPSEIEEEEGSVGTPENDFEPISPVNNNEENNELQNFEPISPDNSPENVSEKEIAINNFENISDDEDDSEKNQTVSQQEVSDNELNFENDDSDQEETNFQSIKETVSNITGSTETELNIETNKTITSENMKTAKEPNDTSADDIDAPIPSPFSDIGDVDDIPDTEGIIDDILKESDNKETGFDIEATNKSMDLISDESENVTKRKDNFELIETTVDKTSDTNENINIVDNLQKPDFHESPDLERDEDSPTTETPPVDLPATETPPVDSPVTETPAGDSGSDETPAEMSSRELPTEEFEKNDASEQEVAHDENGEATKKDDVGENIENEKEDVDDDENDAADESQEDAGDLIANIFGDSDEEEEAFEGFTEEELPPVRDEEVEEEMLSHNKKDHERKDESDDDDDEIPVNDFVSDFDVMMQKRKEMNRMKRKSKKDYDVCGDNDEIIAAMIRQMKEAAEEDRMLNQCGKAATKKLKMLPTVVSHLRKADLQSIFIDCGVLPAMKEWLNPLPDNALPHINIRKIFLKMLLNFPPLDKGALRVSGIGRAVMLLYKHPKECTENKRMAGKIISNWARPIFNVSTNFHEMSREERENRDKMNIPESKRRRLSSDADTSRQRLDDDDDINIPRKPGDKGWIGRARVPMPSHRDYVNRPSTKVENYEFRKEVPKSKLSKFERHARKMRDQRNMQSGTKKAVSISLNGSKMAL